MGGQSAWLISGFDAMECSRSSMFSNLARPPRAISDSLGLKPVAVTLMVISLGAGGGTVAVGAVLPHAATLNVRVHPRAARHPGTTARQLDLRNLRRPVHTNQNLSRTAKWARLSA